MNERFVLEFIILLAVLPVVLIFLRMIKVLFKDLFREERVFYGCVKCGERFLNAWKAIVHDRDCKGVKK